MHAQCLANLEQLDSIHVEFYLDVATIWLIDLFDVGGHLTEESLLDPPLNDAGVLGVRVHIEVGSDDGRADRTRSVDDFLDTRHPKGNM